MILVIFSDIHGNIYALEEFISKTKGIYYDYLVYCGDIFGYYYNQKDVIEKLCQMDKLIWLKGNHDEYFLRLYQEIETDTEEYIKKYGHSYENLRQRFSREEMDTIKKLDSKFVLKTNKGDIGIFHGTPENSLEGRLYPNDSILDSKLYDEFDIVILGHTHHRMIRREKDTLIVNSGSLGQPRDGSGYGYAILDTDAKQVKFENIFFDEQLLYKQIDQYDRNLTKLKEVLERGK